jgi:L-histidine N-alpha-methyltransferase
MTKTVKDDARLTIEVRRPADGASTLASDVRSGFSAAPKRLAPKHFYDDVGSRLFDAICDTPEYYQTRTEHALLQSVARDVIATTRPTDLVELGSGAARKTRVLLDAIASAGLRCRYVPFDVSEGMLRETAQALLDEYPWLTVRGIVGDYDRDLWDFPPGQRRLFLFLGSTIGNFEHDAAVSFLRVLAAQMGPSDYLLLGLDLVKDARLLDAAYNDAQGITAEFNKNVLRVINRELGGQFDVDAFEHLAFFDERTARIEMHLRSARRQTVTIQALELAASFSEGERVLTEISRKFTAESARVMVGAAGLDLCEWLTPPNEFFALALCRAATPHVGP